MGKIEKVIKNETDCEMLLTEVVLYELNSLESEGLDPDNCKLFRSGRHKNDMPSVCTFGKFDDAMKDCIGSVKESGDGKDEGKNNVIISDHLTILGNDDNALFIAFLSGEHQLFRTEVYVDDNGRFNGLKVFVEFNCILKPGEERKTECLLVTKTDNVAKSIREWAIGRTENIKVLEKKRPAVFCTWYYYELNVTYEDVAVNLAKIKEKSLPFDVFQIDEGWEITLGEWEPNKKFPKPMKEIAEEIKAAGLTPGIWTSPFVAHETASIWKTHPEWILKDSEGSPVLFPMNDTVYYIFDITIKETWVYFEELYRKLTFDWGYTYHKLDFTRAPIAADNGCFADKSLTLAECYREAVCAIRRGMGKDSYFLMCGGLYDPIIGLVDAQRTGSDVLSMWSSTINKNGKTAPYTIKQSLLRYYMNYWWHNDPDALMVRRNEVMERNSRLTYGLLNDEEVKTSTINQLIGGGIVCSTEPLDKIDEDRLANLYHILPIRPVETEPVDIMSIGRFPDRVRLREIGNADNSYLAIINWNDDNGIEPELTAHDIAGEQVAENDCFEVVDFYARKQYTDISRESRIRIDCIEPHGATIIKMSKAGQTSEVDYNGHYLM